MTADEIVQNCEASIKSVVESLESALGSLCGMLPRRRRRVQNRRKSDRE